MREDSDGRDKIKAVARFEGTGSGRDGHGSEGNAKSK